MLHYILDGYNITHKVTSLQGGLTSIGSIQQSRDRLLRYIRTKHPQGSLKNKVTVVFDGNAEVIDYPQVEVIGIEVIFTHNISADDHIIQLIKKSANPKIIVVVSDDKEVQNRALLLGAKVSKVKDFFVAYKSEPCKADKIGLTLVELREIENELLDRTQV
ncbi:MAG: NYN domain-containing protein [Candidatus Stahlbacteria bacterium]|nr:NYN domain-containing protein [Candidatus Stahlbacteria bacterium]